MSSDPAQDQPSTEPWSVEYTGPAKRALAERLPVEVAIACLAFIEGDLSDNPFKCGTQLDPPLYPAYSARRGEYRVIYLINARLRTITIKTIDHRGIVYHRGRSGM
jgi:mRNA interferase RelE/StbE